MRTRFLIPIALILLAVLGYFGWQHKSGGNGAPTLDDPGADKVKFELVDANYRSFKGSPALGLAFSRELSAQNNFDPHVRVFEMPPRSEDGNTPEQIKARDKEYERYGTEEERGSATKVSTTANDTNMEEGKAISGAWVVGDGARMLFFPHVKPNTRYVVQVMPSLPAKNGNHLEKESRYSILTTAVPPSYSFASKGMVLPPKNGGLPVITVNVPEVDVQFLRVKPDQLSAFLERVVGKKKTSSTSEEDVEEEESYYESQSLKGNVYAYTLDRIHRMTESVFTTRFVTEQKPNKKSTTFLPVEDIKELKTPGIYVAVMSQPNRFKTEYEVTYFYVSDLGLHLRQFEKNADAYVSSLSDGKGLSGVEVSWLDAQGKVLLTSSTNGDGRAHFDTIPEQARVVLAKKGEQISMIALREPALDLTEFPTTGNTYKPVRLFAYAGRDLYRPGESFDVSVLARDPDGQPVPPQPIEVTLKRPDGKKELTDTWQPDPAFPGYYRQAVHLLADAPTGGWSLELRNDPADRIPAAEFRFGVEEFMPEKMQLDLKAPEKIKSSASQFDIDVTGRYLYGSPAAGNTVTGSASYRPEFQALKETLPGFLFGDMGEESVRERREITSTELDDKGKTRLSVPLEPLAKRKTPFKVTTTVSLLESGGRPVIRNLERVIWPAESLVGIRPLFDDLTTREGSISEFEIVKANTQGKLLAGQALQVRLFRENREYYWRYDDQRNWNTNFTETSDLVYTTSVNVSETGRSKLNLPVQYGRYVVEILDPQTSQSTRIRFYAGWSAKSDEEQAGRPDRVAIKLDKPAYAEGDTAEITLTPPHDGEALITVEGDKTLWVKRTSVSAKGTTVKIPIEKAWKRHDLYINVMTLRPGGNKDRVTPTRALGLAHLPLQRDNRKLDVKVEAPQRMRPDEPLKVTVSAQQLKGQPAMVTLSAVDVGILNITQFTTPDPIAYFFGKLRYGADLHDIYGRIIEQMAGQKGKLRFGGDSAQKNSRSLPKKVKLVDLFSGPVALDADGNAVISLKVPDFNGKLRIMAVVAGQEKFASREAEVTVAAPLVVELATPRFVNLGDTATVALDIQNLSGQDDNIKVKIESEGIKFGIPERELPLKNDQKQTLRFPIETNSSFGLSEVRVHVEGKQSKIERQFALQIQAPTPRQTVRKFLTVQPGETVNFTDADTGPLLRSTVEGNIEISNIPPLSIRNSIQGLVTYPYGCTEQTVSSTYPHLFIDAETAKTYQLKPFSWEQRSEFVAQSLGKLAGRQAPNGGFSSWEQVSNYEYWLSAYVANFMQDAKEAGFKVPEDMQQKTMNFLLKGLQEGVANLPKKPLVYNEKSIWNDWHYAGEGRFGVLAYGAYVLARENKAPLSTLRQLFESKEQAYSNLSLIQLGIALKLMGDEPKSAESIAQGLSMRRKAGYWWGDYGSDVRDLALSQYLLDRYKINQRTGTDLLSELASMIQKDRYFSTQEKMALFLAGHNLANSPQTPWQVTINAGGQDRKLESKNLRIEPLSVTQLAQTGGVKLTNTDSKPLYLAMTLNGHAAQMPTASSNYFNLSRKLYRADGSPLKDKREFNVGESLLVELTVRAQNSVSNALVVDAIPAGFEIENLNLKQGEGLDSIKIGDTNPADAMTNKAILHTEFRDDRFAAVLRLSRGETHNLYYRVRVVTPGRFAFPPTYAEDMYVPSINGIGGSTETVTISDARTSAKVP